MSADQPPKQGPFQLGGKQLSRNGSRGRHGTPLPSNDLDAYSAFIDNSDAVETAQQVTVAISDYGAILKTTERLGDIVKVKKLGAGGCVLQVLVFDWVLSLLARCCAVVDS